MHLYIVKEPVPYEGDNIWVVVGEDANHARAAVKLLKPSSGYLDVSLLPSVNNLKQTTVLWTNS